MKRKISGIAVLTFAIMCMGTTVSAKDVDIVIGDANGYIEINGGYIYCKNTKDGDGIDSNGKIVQNGGILLVNGPTGNGNGT